MTRMPALFIGHGSPMNTLETNGYTSSWRSFGKRLPRPRAILVVSAHWYFGATAVTAMPRPRTIHDFYGFPKELFEFDCPAPGDPDLAQEIVELVKPEWVGLDRDQWGLDHGTWSVLAHLYPDADIPVLQLSINALKPLSYHVAMGSRLSALQDRGVMVLASGNVVHNLKAVRWSEPDAAFDWAERFDNAAVKQMAADPSDVLRLLEHPDYAASVPTPDHFVPLLYLAGMATTRGQPLEPLVRGYSMGSISITCFGLDAQSLSCTEGEGAAILPPSVPAEQTNT